MEIPCTIAIIDAVRNSGENFGVAIYKQFGTPDLICMHVTYEHDNQNGSKRAELGCCDSLVPPMHFFPRDYADFIFAAMNLCGLDPRKCSVMSPRPSLNRDNAFRAAIVSNFKHFYGTDQLYDNSFELIDKLDMYCRCAH
jgi:hypothetical protein